MTDDSTSLSETIKNNIIQCSEARNWNAEVIVNESSLGWIEIQVVTDFFKGKSQFEREESIDESLHSIDLDLGRYPIDSYVLLTKEELDNTKVEGSQLPLWSDILMAPDIPKAPSNDSEALKTPQIITFYSFKGGVGRSTALGITAILLAQQNRRVIVIDFDLEAPGISSLLHKKTANVEQFGVLDYVHQRYLTPEQNVPSIQDCISQVELNSRGELFLVSAGEYNENYVHRLAELDRRAWSTFYQRQINPVDQLLNDIKEYIEPEVILIDARPGFNDTGAVALLDLADTGVICFSPTDQSFDGLRWVIQAARKQSDRKGKPDLRFLLTPMPALADEQLSAWISVAEDWITEHWGLPDDLSVDELCYKVFYNPGIAALSSLVEIPVSLVSDYIPVADFIEASLPEGRTASLDMTNGYESILDELQFVAATAQELQPDSIPTIFQRTGDFPKFLRDRTWLIRGAKGTGKSILFRLFVERPEQAKEFSTDEIDLTDHLFVAGHGPSRLGYSILEGLNFSVYEQEVDENTWPAFWLNYALLQLAVKFSGASVSSGLSEDLALLSRKESITQSEIVSWLIQRAQNPRSILQASDELRAIDLFLSEEKKHVWLLYDELDAGFGSGSESYARRRRALEALLAWWLESGASLSCITPKIFLREDIWTGLNFVNKGHYVGRSLQLKWEESDLWRLVLRQSLQSSQNMRELLSQDLGLNLERLEVVGLNELRKGLYPLWGERMGRGRKAYTYNWIRTRIADSNGNCFPRSLTLLLQEAINREKNFTAEYSSSVILRPRALIEAFPSVSQQRVDEVRNEYPELNEYLNRIVGERSPIDDARLSDIWDVHGSELSSLVKNMVGAGILKDRSRPQDPPPSVYAVAELYLYGLSMTRKGQR